MAASSFGHYNPELTYKDRVTQSLYLPMRDGVRLAIRVSRPAVNGKPVDDRLPVIWQGTLSVTEPPNIATELSGAAYWIVMWAMTKAPIASVASLRETSILFAMMISVFALGEKMTGWRSVAVLSIAAGVVALRLG